MPKAPGHIIGQLNESSLHNQIKYIIAQSTDEVEKKVGDYYIDIVTADNRLIEVQTGGFASIRKKLEALVEDYHITLVYPIAWQKVIVYHDEITGAERSRRKSPKKGRLLDVYGELMRIPDIFIHPNFKLQIALIKIEEYRIQDGKGSWRRKGVSIVNRKLVELVSIVELSDTKDLLNMLPISSDNIFTSKNLATKCNIPRGLSQKICYTLRKMGAIKQVGKDVNAYLYQIQDVNY